MNDDSVSFKLASRMSRGIADIVDVLISIFLTIFTFYIPVIDLIGLVYYLFRDALPFFNGQSIGKKLMNIRAVMSDSHDPITSQYATAFMRTIFQVIPLLSLIDALCIFGLKRQRLGDRIAKTCVIRIKN